MRAREDTCNGGKSSQGTAGPKVAKEEDGGETDDADDLAGFSMLLGSVSRRKGLAVECISIPRGPVIQCVGSGCELLGFASIHDGVYHNKYLCPRGLRYHWRCLVSLLAISSRLGSLFFRFGFDISSMSAWIGTKQYNEYFNRPDSDLQGGVCLSFSIEDVYQQQNV